MKIETLKDVLHWTQKYHLSLSDCLSHCADKNVDERSQMMLNYLAEHEKVLSQVVSEFEKSGDESALNTWCYEFIERNPVVQHVHCDMPFSELSATQILAIVTDQHQQVIELYRYLASRADIPAARELIESLQELEQHEAMRMVHASNRLEGL